MQKLKTYSKYLKESILDPGHDELSLDLWTKENEIQPKVKKQIIDVLDAWKKKIKLSLKVDSINIVGSMTGYNYSDETDIDVHVQFDTDDKEKIERLRDIMPEDVVLTGTKHPVQYYFMRNNEDKEARYHGIYDLMNEKWIKKVVKQEANADDLWESAINQAVSWARKYSLDIDELRRDMKELKIYQHFLAIENDKIDKKRIEKQIASKKMEIKSDYDVLRMNKHMLRSFRTESYDGENFDSKTVEKKSDPDESLNNLTFKILEKLGYFDLANKILEEYEKEFEDK